MCCRAFFVEEETDGFLEMSSEIRIVSFRTPIAMPILYIGMKNKNFS